MNTKDQKSSYRSIFKATSLFGGVQVYKILIQVIKSKFIAILLGPLGVGIQGLYTTATDLIRQFTAMGLSQSAVRDISEAYGANDTNRISTIVKVVRRLVWITGLLGSLSVAILSPLLSKLSFGNYDFTIPFIFLSITLFLDQINAGQLVLLQGTRRLKDLAKASTYGVTLGLFVTVPLYYILSIRGIVPVLILTSVVNLLLSWYFSRKIKVDNVNISSYQTFNEGIGMLKMGFAMSISGMLVAACAYAIRGYIRYVDGTEMVGLFTAGFTILSTYVGMVFSAMGTDFYPRLAMVNKDNQKCREIISQQGEVASLILCPMLLFCMLFMPFIIQLLYSSKFLPAIDYVTWAIPGMMLRLGAWLISFQFVAKGESRLFIINEVFTKLYTLPLSLLGYDFGGLTGMGIGFTIGYLIYFLQVFIIAKRKYQFIFSRNFSLMYLFQLCLILICLISVVLFSGITKYCLGVFLVLISGAYSLFELNRRLDLIKIIKRNI